MTATRRWNTALVTGASSGIGEAIARHLGVSGTRDLILVARRAERLRRLAAELDSAQGCHVEVLVADLGDIAGVELVARRLADDAAPVDLLVNNAGFGTSGPFASSDIDREVDEIDLNVTAVVRLTRAALSSMVPRRRGAVLNVSSLASFQPTPGNATYGATKAFVTAFTEALHEELRGSGVTATAVCPGYTRTEFQQKVGESEYNSAPSWVWMSADDVAAEALAAAANGRAISVPGAGYKIVGVLSDLVPRSAKRRLMGWASGRATQLARRWSR
jgi:short-subunit dehydrogenase